MKERTTHTGYKELSLFPVRGKGASRRQVVFWVGPSLPDIFHILQHFLSSISAGHLSPHQLSPTEQWRSRVALTYCRVRTKWNEKLYQLLHFSFLFVSMQLLKNLPHLSGFFCLGCVLSDHFLKNKGNMPGNSTTPYYLFLLLLFLYF